MFFSRTLLGAKKLTAITSKRGNKNFYKGRNAPSLGYKGTKGKFTFDPSKFTRVSFIAPDLEGFELKAYVAPNTPKIEKSSSTTETVNAQ